MNPVTIQVIPGVKAVSYGYKLKEGLPAEDYSLILMKATRDKKEYHGGVFVPNDRLPLSAVELDALRDAAIKRLPKTEQKGATT